jgi:DNA-binding MurR/RpiR family transcriptional regulator
MGSIDSALLRSLKLGAENFSRNQRALARYLLAHHQTVAFSTISQLARQSGISEATIVRFAKSLGFSGYPALQKEIRRMVRAELRGVERFRLAETRAGSARSPLDAVIEKERENLCALLESFDARAFGRAVALLREAGEVIVVGPRSAAPLAQHLWFALSKLGYRATRVTAISSETYDRLSRAGREACVVLIGYPRYLREQVALLDYARSCKLATLTITDSVVSPLQGSVSLYAPAESGSFVAFHCAPLVLINALVRELSLADKARTEAALEAFESVAERQSYFIKY